MNKILKCTLATVLAGLIALSAASCAKQSKTQLDLEKFPLVYADENGLEAINEGEEKPFLITKNFYTFMNAERKVQAASDGKIYYIETKNKTTSLGDLYAFDVTKKEAELIHSGVFSFKVSHDGECIIFSDGTGGIYRYDGKSEKKENYVPIQRKGVSAVLDISADGKYVLYTQVLEATKYYTLTMARTDFQTTDEIDKLSLKERKANTDISKAPVILGENYKEYIGAADDLSVVYFTQSVTQKGQKEPVITLNAFTNYETKTLLSNRNFTNYSVSSDGEILFSLTGKNGKKISDVVSDKYAKDDAALKKAKASAKAWKAKTARDNIREKINTYLKNISTTIFFRFKKGDEKPQNVLEVNGQITQKGMDSEYNSVFFGGTLYDFSSAKKPDIGKVTMAYKLFDALKSRAFFAVNADGLKTLKIDDKTTYNSGDCYVDTAAKKINIIMDMDYLKTKVGKLYSVAYTEKDFGKSTLISDKAAKVAHFDSGDDVYFALANNTLVMNNEKTAVLKNYASSSLNNKVKMVFTAVGTGKKDKFGNEIMDETAYVINGKKAEKMDKVFTSKNIVDKGNMFAFYTSYDYKKGAGEMKLFNGEKVITLSKQVSVIYKFA